MHFQFQGVLKATVLSAAMIALFGCGDSVGPRAPQLAGADLPKRVSLAHEYAIMAVGETLDLGFQLLSVEDTPLHVTNPGDLVWTTSDPTIATVDARGVVLAAGASSPQSYVTIKVSAVYNGVTRSRSAYIHVTTGRNAIRRIKLVATGDSARTSYVASFFQPTSGVSVYALDSTGARIGPARAALFTKLPRQEDLTLTYYGPSGELFGTGHYLMSSLVIGDYWLYAASNIYGTQMTDSMKFTGLYPGKVTVDITSDSVLGLSSLYDGHDAMIQSCALIAFENRSSTPVDVTFDDPERTAICAAGDTTGNIDAIPTGQTRTRKVRQVGTTRWSVRPSAIPQATTTMPAKVLGGTITTREP